MIHSGPSPDQVREILARQFAELAPIADGLRAAMRDGQSPQSLGPTADGLADVLRQRGISEELVDDDPVSNRPLPPSG